jgi:SAM-dependent methyltransferase
MRNIDPFWGPYDRDSGWVPSLRYLLRRARLLAFFADGQRGRLLEVGCGAGALLIELAHLGYDCTGLETSERAHAHATHLAGVYGFDATRLHRNPSSGWHAYFDFVLASDVLEHIEDDRGALLQWAEWLRPGAKLVLTVPAHSRAWSAGDVWAGHFRRYDKTPLVTLLEKSGYSVNHIECYGFPLANLTETFGAFYYKRALAKRVRYSKNQASSLSGIERRPYLLAYRMVHSWAGKALLQLGMAMQDTSLTSDLGSGYLVVASRSCVA